MTQPASDLSRKLLLLLAAIGILGSVAIHMIVPALPHIAADLSAEPAFAQLAISLYLASLGMGQLLGGSVSDLIGRRPVLLASVATFICGSLCCSVSETIYIFLASRVLQALGGGAAVVVARTIIADLSESKDMAARVAGFTTVVLMSPALAPFVGGILQNAGGWRSIFWFLTMVGLAMGLLVWRYFTESFSPVVPSGRSRHFARGLVRVVRAAGFWKFALPMAFASSAMYIFLAGSSFLLIDRYGLSAPEAGACYLVVATCGIAGTFLVKQLETTGFGAFKTGLVIATGGATLMLVGAAAGLQGVAALIAPMLLVGVGAGVAAPAGFAGIMRSVEGLAGTASSLGGAVQMMVTGATTSLVSALQTTEFLPLAAAIFVTSLIGLSLAPRGAIHTVENRP